MVAVDQQQDIGAKPLGGFIVDDMSRKGGGRGDTDQQSGPGLQKTQQQGESEGEVQKHQEMCNRSPLTQGGGARCVKSPLTLLI